MARSNKGPVLTVDALIEDEQGRILLIQRGVKPFKGFWCLPGGKVDEGERVEAALEREVMEELGVRIGIRELAGVYSEPDRDPRGHFVSVVFHATMIGGEPHTTDEASDMMWLGMKDKDIEIGFDHSKILQDWWTRKISANGKVVSRVEQKIKKDPSPRTHPVDDKLVKQVEDERIEGVRFVEDEAGRGKRAVKLGTRASATKASPMRGSGTKRTGVTGKATTGRNK